MVEWEIRLAISVRRGQREDLQTTQELNAALYSYEEQLGFYDDSYDLNWTYGDNGTRYFSRCLSDEDPTSVVFLAFDSDRAVGYLAGGYASPAYRSQTPIAEIHNMFVLEEARRAGIGSGLVGAFRHWAEQSGVVRMSVAAFAPNSSAISFYRKCGFHEHEITLEMKLHQ